MAGERDMSDWRLGRTGRVLGAILVMMTCVGGRNAAEVVVMRDGTRLTGKCTAGKRDVSVSGTFATTSVPRAMIARIELTEGERKDLERLKLQSEREGAQGQFNVGKWLDKHLQYDEAQKYYTRAIELDPNHASTRKVLGYRREGDKWVDVPSEQIARAAQGFGSGAADACVELGKTFAGKKLSAPAENAFRKALMADPRHKEALKLIGPYLTERKLKNHYRNPLDGTTRVVMGDDHPEAAFMLNALDLVKVDTEGRSYTGDAGRLESHYTFNTPVYAAAGGEVFAVLNNYPDTPVGKPGKFEEANSVCIKHPSGEYTLYAHLKRGSIVVKPGQTVKAGTPLGRVGNSGSAMIPHLHFCVYDGDGISLPVTFTDDATTAK